MLNRAEFARSIAALSLSHVENAIAFLWYYRQTQEFDERTASELANDLKDENFPKPNVTRLRADLTRNRAVIRGRRNGSFQLNLKQLDNLDDLYSDLLQIKKITVTDSIIPNDWTNGTRLYIERMVYQINGSYEYGFYDACATLCRRLMESLIIEVYIHSGQTHEIQNNGVFFGLEKLISKISNDNQINLSRNTQKSMMLIKELGDTAAHDRVYITHQQDIDDVKAKYRRVIQDLLNASGISK